MRRSEIIMQPDLLSNAYQRVRFDQDLVFRFFISFSLFEKALKESGFYFSTDRIGVNPNWDKFIQSIAPQFIEIIDSHHFPELEAAVSYLFEFPPNKQIMDDHHLTFKQTEIEENHKDIVKLSMYIRRVRNNLFHGAKFSYDFDHDSKLIRYSLVILECWANLNEDVEYVLITVF